MTGASQSGAKRAIDIALSLIGLVVLSPVAAGIVIAIKMEDGGPALFTATRVGWRGRPFGMLKFRTMVLDAEARLAGLQHLNRGGSLMIKIPNDPRITHVGGVLRATHLDEIPQLINVLRGEMSLVGPRPQYPREVAHYTSAQRRRLEVRPGITGLCQVRAPDSADFEEWVRHDLTYIDDWSLLLDVRIMALTVPLMVRGLRPNRVARSAAWTSANGCSVTRTTSEAKH